MKMFLNSFHSMGRCQRGVHFGAACLKRGEESSKFPIAFFSAKEAFSSKEASLLGLPHNTGIEIDPLRIYDRKRKLFCMEITRSNHCEDRVTKRAR